MRHGSGPESEQFVHCSEQILLHCRCGEKLVLLGQEDDWYSEGRTEFECECGQRLALPERSYGEDSAEGLDEEALAVRELLRGLGLHGNR